MYQARRVTLGGELLRPVKVCRCEVRRVPRGIPVTPVVQVGCDDARERGVNQVAAAQPVDRRCKPRDGRGNHHAAGPAHPPGFGKDADTIVAFR